MYNYNFVKFDGIYSRGDTKIGLNKSGLIRLSSGFCRETNSNTYKYCLLFYDKLNKAIAIKFTNDKEDGRLKVTIDGTGATISSSRFMKANGLNLRSYAGRYEWKKLHIPNIGDVIVIDLINK